MIILLQVTGDDSIPSDAALDQNRRIPSLNAYS